tara:strand:+ start:413 stop:628 length:216 start_codon:yes stop_codon:yes gene_type:complete
MKIKDELKEKFGYDVTDLTSIANEDYINDEYKLSYNLELDCLVLSDSEGLNVKLKVVNDKTDNSSQEDSKQ